MRIVYPLAVVAGVLLAASLAYSLRAEVAYAEDPPQSWELTSLRSENASLRAELYRANLERCESLGVHPVPPPKGKAGR